MVAGFFVVAASRHLFVWSEPSIVWVFYVICTYYISDMYICKGRRYIRHVHPETDVFQNHVWSKHMKTGKSRIRKFCFFSNLRKRTRARCICTCVWTWRYCFHEQCVACIFPNWKNLPNTTAQDISKLSAFLNTHVLLYVFEYICVYRYMYVFISIPRCSFRKRSFLQVWSIRQDVACIFRSGEWYRIVRELRYEETENVVL